MKTPLILLAAFTVTAAADETIIPVAWSKDRFHDMLGKSPFALATPPVEKGMDVPDIFANLYVKGLGRDYVAIQRIGDDRAMQLWGNTPNAQQFFVKEVHWSAQPGLTKVVLKNGEQEREIGFNPSDVHGPPPPAPPRKPPLYKTQQKATGVPVPVNKNPVPTPPKVYLHNSNPGSAGVNVQLKSANDGTGDRKRVYPPK
jgi:hypothetical protein